MRRGKETDTGWDIAVNASGQAYVTGQTDSTDFPTTGNAFDMTCGTDGRCDSNKSFLSDDAFVAKLDVDGNALVYSSFLGGAGVDSGRGIAVDDAGGAYVVTGWTQSSDFPVLGPGVDDPFQPFLAGIQDAFVVKVSDASDPDEPPGGCSGFTLTATGYKVKGKQKADLEWCGATSASVDITRDGNPLVTIENDGSHTDNIDLKGGGSYTYQICEAGITTCSNSATVTF